MLGEGLDDLQPEDVLGSSNFVAAEFGEFRDRSLERRAGCRRLIPRCTSLGALTPEL